MSKPTSIDTLLEDVVLGRACGEREWNPLAQEPFDEYRSDRNIALEWFASRRITYDDVQPVQATPKGLSLVSFAEITSAWRTIGTGLFGKR
jgi:hypothetical protein